MEIKFKIKITNPEIGLKDRKDFFPNRSSFIIKGKKEIILNKMIVIDTPKVPCATNSHDNKI